MTQETAEQIFDRILYPGNGIAQYDALIRTLAIKAMEMYGDQRAAAERARLLEEAGMPSAVETNDNLNALVQVHGTQASIAVARDLAEWMRSRCSALLVKEREKHAQDLNAFDDWTRKNLWYYRGHMEAIPGMEGWYTAARLVDERGPFKLRQLYERFEKEGEGG